VLQQSVGESTNKIIDKDLVKAL